MSAVPPGGESALQVHAAHEAESCGFPQKTPLQDRPGGHPVHALPMLCTGAGRALTGRAAGAMGRTGRPPSVALGGDRNRGAPASCSQGSARRPGRDVAAPLDLAPAATRSPCGASGRCLDCMRAA